MFLRKKETAGADTFWQDYEASVNEKVLARALGQYMSGIAEYSYPLWGLVIATSGGFRFHHFPHEGWIMALSRITTGGPSPKEKTFFIPRNDILSIELITEKRWWKKILSPSNPTLLINCRVNGEEAQVVIETDKSASAIVEALDATA